MKKSYTANLASLNEIAKDIEEFCNTCGVSGNDVYAINLAVDELFTNSVVYGYENNADAVVDVEIECQANKVKIVLSDYAPKFNPLQEVEAPDLNSDIETRKIGGLGVFFAKKQMNEISYAYNDGKNVITMYRNISNAKK